MEDALRAELRAFLRLPSASEAIAVVRNEVRADGYTRKLVSYETPEGDTIEAFLFEPLDGRAAGGVVFLHQHASDWQLGKSEVAGLGGDPRQAFGPALARAGVTVLAPDAVGFETRRGPGDDWLQYYNHAMHRLVRGELLMTKVLSDVALAVSVLAVGGITRVGVAGHSYGGNVALFAAALDARFAFACASGAACSYRHKLAAGTGLEMALVIPGFAARFDVDDLLRCIAPRPLFVVSSSEDPYSADAEDLVARARPTYAGNEASLEHLRVDGAHALDEQRFAAIVAWLSARAVRP
jgi:dienelactone hydrolase